MSHSVNDLLSQSQSRNQQGSANNLVKASKSTKRRPIKKRKYSRGGCKECKRRRLKCDEGKPSCWNCAHLNKICVYEKKIKFVPSTGYVADQSTAALGKASNDEGVGCSRSFEPLPSFKSVSSTVSEPSSFEFRHQALPNLGYPSNVISSSTGTQFLGSSLNMGASSQQIGHNGGDIFRMPQSSHFIFATPSIPLAQKQQVNDNLFNGASNVISDLNDIIQHYNFEPASSQNVFYNTQSQQQPQLPQSSYLPIHNVPTSYALSNVGSTGNADVSSGTEPDSQNGTKKWLHTSNRSKSKRNGRKEGHQLKQQGLSAYPSPPIAITTSKSSHRFDYLYVLNHTISSSELLSLCEYFGWSANDSHINYIKIFVTKIQMKFIPFTTSFLNNAYIKCFLYEAKSSPHLLYAMLAISAKYELTKVSETKTGISDSQRIQTMEFHRKSRSDYLKMCTEALDLIMNSKTKTLENIESLLMTILVLGSDFSGVEGSQWRSHLKGAKNLLLQYCKFRPVSLELVIVWLWFCSMETLAGLTTFNGGTIHDFDEMQEFLEAVKSGNSSIGLALRKFGFLFGGYYVEEHGSAILKDKKSFITGERNPLRKVSRHHNKSGKNDSLDSGSNSDSSNGYNSSGSSDESMGQSKKAERHNEAANFIVVGGQRIRKVMNYNLYVGYNDDVMDVMNGIFIAIECIRKFKQGVENDNQIFEVLNRSGTLKNEQIVKLFAAISKARSFTVINNQVPYRIPLDSPYHPLNKKGYHYNNPTGVNVIISGYIHDTNPNTKSSKEADNWYSWLDLSQQLYVDACLLRLLTMEDGLSSNGLSIKNSMVQDVVNRMIESLGCLVSFAKSVGSEGMEALNCHFNEPSVVGKDSTGDDGVSRHGLSASMAKYGATADTLGMANDSSIEELTMFGPLTREKALNIQKEHELENSEKNARMRRGSSSSSSSNGQIQFQDYLYYQLDSRLVMVQWPLFVCGLCCVNPKHKLIISCCFNTLMNLGVESSEMTFARVVRLWHRQREGLFDYEHQNVFEDSGDSVPFT